MARSPGISGALHQPVIGELSPQESLEFVLLIGEDVSGLKVHERVPQSDRKSCVLRRRCAALKASQTTALEQPLPLLKRIQVPPMMPL
jgi:hypothetical protein